MKKKVNTVQKSVGLPPFVWARIEEEANRICVTQTAYLRSIVESYFRELDEKRKEE